jgi:hypothetical protein
MPRKSTTEKLQTLRKKRDQLDAQMKLLDARRKQSERKADTRRKVIAGALALEHFEANRESEFARVLFRLMDEYVTRPYDRVLFPFLSAPATDNGESRPESPADDFARVARETADEGGPPVP